MSSKRAGAPIIGAVTGQWSLPKDWQWVRLGDYARTVSGGRLKLTKSHYVSEGFPAFCAAGQDGFVEVAECDSEAVILSSIGARCGKAFYARGQWTSLANTQLIFPREDLQARYLWYYVNNEERWERSGSAQPFIKPSTIQNLPIPLPPIHVQYEVALRIDALFSDIDDGEAALARGRADLEVYRRALLKAAVTGELTAEWRAANPPRETGPQLLARILADRRARWEADPKNKEKKYSAPILPIVSNLPDLPNQWAWASLDQLCGHITSGSRAWSPYYDLGEAVFVMAQNVRRGYYDKTFEQLVGPPANDPERMRTRVLKSDLLLTIVGANTGDICSVNFDPEERYVCQSVALLRPLMPELAPFVEAFFANEFGRKLQMEKLIYGAGRPHLSFDQIRSLAVPLCPLVEIDQVSRHISQAHSVSNPIFETLDSLSNSATELRQSILSAAFRGELSPS